MRLQRTPLSSVLALHVRHYSAKQVTRIRSYVFSSSLGSFPHSSLLMYAIPQGPLTRNVKGSLNTTNPDADPVSLIIKTTAPKVRPSCV